MRRNDATAPVRATYAAQRNPFKHLKPMGEKNLEDAEITQVNAYTGTIENKVKVWNNRRENQEWKIILLAHNWLACKGRNKSPERWLCLERLNIKWYMKVKCDVRANMNRKWPDQMWQVHSRMKCTIGPIYYCHFGHRSVAAYKFGTWFASQAPSILVTIVIGSKSSRVHKSLLGDRS